MSSDALQPTWPPVDDVDPGATWAACGGLWLTGRPGAAPLHAPPDTTRVLTSAARRLEALAAGFGQPLSVDGPALLGERAAHAGFSRNGTTSVGGAARLFPAADGWIAASLPRPEDVELIPAWLGVPATAANVWGVVERAVRERSTGGVVDQAALLGIPCSALGEVPPGASPAVVERLGDAHAPRSLDGLLVADLSSLWAGPLCADLLGRAGARVIKVESSGRPDGARDGPPTFFELLHGGHEAVALDFTTAEGRSALAALLAHADVVIEASRPRALEQLGIEARRVVGDGGPQVWLSITAHGRSGDGRNRVGFGDDAAVAGGLIARDAIGPCFCADAIADPATGLIAATTVLELLASGGRFLADLALSRTAARLTGDGGDPTTNPEPRALEPLAPRSRRALAPAPRLGQHTATVLAELGIDHQPRV